MHSTLDTALSLAAGLAFGLILVFIAKRRRKENS